MMCLEKTYNSGKPCVVSQKVRHTATKGRNLSKKKKKMYPKESVVQEYSW